MRVLSGKYKNRKLKSLPDQSVRPTSSLVKKSLFDTIYFFDEKKVLDLFSGTGSLGIESFSRGAKKVVFVEKNRKMFNILSDNVNSICLDQNFLLINKDVDTFLNSEEDLYDIIFADPPYNLISFKELRYKVCKMLKYGGIFCMEKRSDNENYDKDVRIKQYGKTEVLIWKKQKK